MTECQTGEKVNVLSIYPDCCGCLAPVKHALILFVLLKAEVSKALCNLNNTVLGKIGNEFQNQLKWPDVNEYQVT